MRSPDSESPPNDPASAGERRATTTTAQVCAAIHAARAGAFMAAHPSVDRAEVRVFARLAIESAYASQEMLFDDPELDPIVVGRMLAAMVAGEAVRLRRRVRNSGG